mmetsp:Transcript_60810/g.191188  ORF Transcript_60810/g.191188 Transcript_60810/m.191188 type:complete len:234 (+) Transcript_60810:399-1100(+)
MVRVPAQALEHRGPLHCPHLPGHAGLDESLHDRPLAVAHERLQELVPLLGVRGASEPRAQRPPERGRGGEPDPQRRPADVRPRRGPGHQDAPARGQVGLRLLHRLPDQALVPAETQQQQERRPQHGVVLGLAGGGGRPAQAQPLRRQQLRREPPHRWYALSEGVEEAPQRAERGAPDQGVGLQRQQPPQEAEELAGADPPCAEERKGVVDQARAVQRHQPRIRAIRGCSYEGL